MLLMNVLMSQGMDKAQATAQVQAQLTQMQGGSSKQPKEGRNQGIEMRAGGSHPIPSGSTSAQQKPGSGRMIGSTRMMQSMQDSSLGQSSKYNYVHGMPEGRPHVSQSTLGQPKSSMSHQY